MEDLHEIQFSILKELLFNNGAHFSSLNKTELTNDHFTFHIKRLVELELIEKKDNKYFLTSKGKEFSGRLDTDSLKIEKFGKNGVLLTAIKKENNEKYYLVQQRMKEPFSESFGFITGKVRYGDTALETAKRELFEEAGLTGVPRCLGVRHERAGVDEAHISLDVYFHMYVFENVKENLIDTKEGKNFWMTEKEILGLKDISKVMHGFLEDKFWIMQAGKYQKYKEIFYKLNSI